MLTQLLGRVVVDKTGLAGAYEFDLSWAPESYESMGVGRMPPLMAESGPGGDGPSLLTALRQQLGLRMESKKTPLAVVVVDWAERPGDNWCSHRPAAATASERLHG